jgi:hypothetical protein
MASVTNIEVIGTRKLKGRTRRSVTLSTKITQQELEMISAACAADGRALGEWVREVVLMAARSPSVALGADQLMTEIVGLQLFLTNALSPLARGERMSQEQYEALMQNVKTHKHRAAREVMALYAAEKVKDGHA